NPNMAEVEELTMKDVVLQGRHIRLEPLERRHIEGLTAASAVDRELYRWSFVPQGEDEVAKYVETALAWRDAGTALPFAILDIAQGAGLGSSRFFDIERWSWPQPHARHGRTTPDSCEIGYTWLTRSAIRTPINTEAKFLMLAHAFEKWQVLRVCF